MTPSNLIPALDPNPLPGPYWMLKLLLVITFILHIVAMNFMLGGAVMALGAKWTAKDRSHGARVFFDVAKKLPALLPATITLGVAPLLFVQALYGQFFYTSSIVMAWPWFLVLVFVTIAYYGFYWVSFRGRRDARRAGQVMLAGTVLVTLVGFALSNNVTLEPDTRALGGEVLRPSLGLESEPGRAHAHSALSALLCVGGGAWAESCWFSWRWPTGSGTTSTRARLLSLGGKTFLYATMAQFVVGIVFLITLPREMRMLFMGDSPVASAMFLVGIAGGAAAIMVMSSALRKGDIRAAAFSRPPFSLVVIVSMTVMRDNLRDAYLKPYFHPEQFAVKTQWEALPLFLVLFVAGVVLWLVMMRRAGLLGGKKAG